MLEEFGAIGDSYHFHSIYMQVLKTPQDSESGADYDWCGGN